MLLDMMKKMILRIPHVLLKTEKTSRLISAMTEYGVIPSTAEIQKKLWETALKSDLSDFVKVLQFNTITESWAAGAENRVTIPIPAPSGYRTISIVRAWVSNPFILTANAYIEGASVIVHGRNIENNVLENVYAYANILYVKP